jgi:hypothetical protein
MHGIIIILALVNCNYAQVPIIVVISTITVYTYGYTSRIACTYKSNYTVRVQGQ